MPRWVGAKAYNHPRRPAALVRVNLRRLASGILMAVADGVNTSGNLMFAHAKTHAPVRKIYHYGDAGKGRRRGLRLQSPDEVAAEGALRQRMGLAPGAVMTAGRPNPRNAANPLSMRNRHHVDTYNTSLPDVYPTRKLVESSTGRGKVFRPALAKFKVTVDDTSPYRAVEQREFNASAGGRRLDVPTTRSDRRAGIFRGGSLRREERRIGLPAGALGHYQLEHTESFAQHLTARGRFELGILKSGAPSTALNAGRAVTVGEGGGLQVGGRLRRELHVAQEAQPGPLMTFTVESPTPYAKYVEFGTRHAGAQPYLRPAVAHIRERLRNDIKRAVRKAATYSREV